MMQSVRPQTQYDLSETKGRNPFPATRPWNVARGTGSEISGRLPLFRAQSVPSYL